MDDCEPVLHCLQSEVEQSRVADSLNVVQLPEDAEKGLVVKADSEVGEAKDEEFALVKAVDSGEGLSLDRVVPGLCSRVELAPTVYRLPARIAAARNVSLALAMFLCEPESYPELGPVCGQGCGKFGIEEPHTFLTLFNDFSF